MSSAIDYLLQLDLEDKYWISSIRNTICQEGIIQENVLEELCKKFTHKEKIICELKESKTSSEFQDQELLYRLSENKNVRGLLDEREIIFSPFITVIYGKNGSGKSTFYKVLKDAFNQPQNIEGNIYNPKNIIPSALIEFTNKKKYYKFQRGGINYDFSKNRKCNWKPGEKFQNNIKFCDNEILAQSLKKKESGWSLDRYKLNLFDYFQDSLNKVEKIIAEEIQKKDFILKVKYEELIRGFKEDPDEELRGKALNAEILWNSRSILLNQFLNSKLPDNAEHLRKELYKDINSSSEEIIIKLKSLTTETDTLKGLLNYLNNKIRLITGLSQLNELIDKVNSIKNSRDTTELDRYELLFSTTNQENKEEYFDLIKKIAELAINLKLEDYPNSITKCFYCNQDIPEDNKKIIQKIHKLVSNETEKELEKLRIQLEKSINFIDKNILYESHDSSILNLLFSIQIYSTHTKKITYLEDLLEKCISKEPFENIRASIKNNILINLSDVNNFLNNLALMLDIVNSQIYLKDYESNYLTNSLSNLELNRAKSQRNLNQILDLEYCMNSISLIKEIILLIDELSLYKKEISHFKGLRQKISNKRKEAEKELITEKYIERFKEYLNKFKLNKRDKISRGSRIEGGKSIIESNSSGEYKIENILSEGEAKVHSICDWFAELELSDANIAVFDDPITSLDQGNIEYLAKNIINLTKSHQVVVFTHNLEFYNSLVEHTVGKGELHKPGCILCKEFVDSEKCKGYIKTHDKLLKCSNFYQVKYFTEPGNLENGILLIVYPI